MSNLSTIRISAFVFLVLLLSSANRVLPQKYNKRLDYVYNFEGTGAKVHELTIVKNKLDIPVFTENYQTAFLEVIIRTSPGGRLFEPNVKMNGNGISLCQYFEYGAKGKRYINVSEFVCRGLKFITFKFNHCHIVHKQVKLILFKNPGIEKESLVVLAPHPDDAEIAAYGLYSSNKDAFVATVTVGDAGKKIYDELYPDDSVHYLKKAGIRLWNSITVPMLAGVNPRNIINLGYFDASLKQMYSDTAKKAKARYTGTDNINIYRSRNISAFLDSVPGISTWRSLVNDMKHIILARKPAVIVTPYPAIDVHPDHKLTTVALIEALKELNYFNVELWLYTNHFIYDEMYPVGKVRSLVSLPPNTVEKTIYFNRICSFPLSGVMQSDKTLALEAMNPLRPDTEWHTTKGIRKLYWKTLRENLRNTENDYYYRRAVRNNELFFIVDMTSLLDDSILKTVTGDLNF
jgi:LmbE family N-acetylglucosaminyl deacetylase